MWLRILQNKLFHVQQDAVLAEVYAVPEIEQLVHAQQMQSLRSATWKQYFQSQCVQHDQLCHAFRDASVLFCFLFVVGTTLAISVIVALAVVGWLLTCGVAVVAATCTEQRHWFRKMRAWAGPTNTPVLLDDWAPICRSVLWLQRVNQWYHFIYGYAEIAIGVTLGMLLLQIIFQWM